MNLISSTRAELGLSQVEFGAWLAKQAGRDAPYSRQQVCDWEHGRKSPRRNIRDICAPIAARACAVQTCVELGMLDVDIDALAALIVENQR